MGHGIDPFIAQKRRHLLRLDARLPAIRLEEQCLPSGKVGRKCREGTGLLKNRHVGADPLAIARSCRAHCVVVAGT